MPTDCDADALPTTPSRHYQLSMPYTVYQEAKRARNVLLTSDVNFKTVFSRS